MNIIAGIIIGLLIALFVVVIELYYIQRGKTIIQTIKQKTAPKAELLLPKSTEQRAIDERIKQADKHGEDIKWFDEPI